jgi:uncharacterized protein YdgA (DUF945 family)
MKKVLIGVAILVVLLVAAPYGIGVIAAQRIEKGFDQAVKQAPYMRISERKYHAGWFNSELDLTVELFSGLGRGVAPSFKLHQDIRHGPILGSDIGLARIKTHLVLEPDTRAELKQFFGTEEPIDITTVIGFLGGATTVVSSDAHSFESDIGKTSWDALKVVAVASGNGDTFTIEGKWPRVEGNATDGTEVAMRGLSVMGGGKRIVGDLYDTDLDFAVDEVRIKSPTDSFEIEKVRYVDAMEPDGELLNMSTRMGCSSFKSSKLSLTDLHYDFSVQRLHAATFEKLMAELKLAYGDVGKAAANADESMLGPYREHALELLKHDPVLVIERVGFATEEGAGLIKGTIKLKGVTAEDFDNSGMSLIGRIVADIDVDLSEAMLEKLTGSPEAAEGMVGQGIVERKDGHLVSKIQFQEGKLLINGQEQALPGVGGPPAGPPAVEE